MFKCKKVRKVRWLMALGLSALTMGAGVMSGSVAGASPVAVGHEIKNPDNSPMVVHWAVLTSTPGQMKKWGPMQRSWLDLNRCVKKERTCFTVVPRQIIPM